MQGCGQILSGVRDARTRRLGDYRATTWQQVGECRFVVPDATDRVSDANSRLGNPAPAWAVPSAEPSMFQRTRCSVASRREQRGQTSAREWDAIQRKGDGLRFPFGPQSTRQQASLIAVNTASPRALQLRNSDRPVQAVT